MFFQWLNLFNKSNIFLKSSGKSDSNLINLQVVGCLKPMLFACKACLFNNFNLKEPINEDLSASKKSY